MSAANPCTCPGTRKEKMKNWVVNQYKCNHSAFNGYHYTRSDYSAISCTKCRGFWRTKAGYVEKLRWSKLGRNNASNGVLPA